MELDLKLNQEKPELGKKYPVYGTITGFISEELGNVIVEVNNNIRCNMVINSEDRLNKLKNRSFEPGIFVSTVINVEPTLVLDCHTVIFGRQENKELN